MPGGLDVSSLQGDDTFDLSDYSTDQTFGGSVQSTTGFDGVDVTNPSIGSGSAGSAGSLNLTTPSTVDLGGASLATVTPNPTISTVGNNSTASDAQALSGVVNSLGYAIGDLLGGSGPSPAPGTVRIVGGGSTAATTGLSRPMLVLILVAVGLVAYLLLEE
jgi:hypothetical protein